MRRRLLSLSLALALLAAFAPAPAPAQTAFTTAIGNVSTTLGGGYTAGSGSMALAAGAGVKFGSPSPAHPVRYRVITAATYLTAGEAFAIFKATGRTGDTLTGVAAGDGTADRNFAAGDRVEIRLEAAHINDLSAAVNALEVAAGNGNAPADHTGAKFANAHLAPYSAPTDGSDASAAIQAADTALGSSGTIWFPEGSYTVSHPIWPGPGMALRGFSSATTAIVGTPGIHPIILGVFKQAPWNRSATDGYNLGGTVTLTNGSTAVVGSGGSFTKELRPGTRFKVGAGSNVSIASIASDTSATLTAPYAGTTATGTATTTTPYLATIPAAFAADHRPDSFGVLDTSMATAPGQQWGLSTRSPSSGSIYPDHFATWWATPPATGKGKDRWSTVNKFTLSWFVSPPNSLGLPGTAIMGMGSSGGPSPWYLSRQGNQFLFQFLTSADAAGATPRAIYFGDTRLSGPTRITLQLDFTATDWNSGTACSIRAWINRQEIAVNHNAAGSYGIGGATGPSFKPGDNLKFATNYYAPFNLGASTPAQTQWCNPERACDRGDSTTHGLCMSADALYESDVAGVGGNQRFKVGGTGSGLTLNDARQFYGGPDYSVNEICHLNTATPTATTSDYTGKYVWMESGPASSNVRFLGLMNCSLGDLSGGAISNNEVSDLTISPWGGYNAGISVGQCLDPKFRRLDITPGWWGIGSFATSAGTYNVLVEDSKLAGTDAGYYGTSQIVSIRNMALVDCGHTAVRLVGSEAHLDGIHVGNPAQSVTDAYIRMHGASYSSVYRIKDLFVDVEGAGSNAPPAAVWCDRHPTGNTILDIDGVGWGGLLSGAAGVRLAKPGGVGTGVGTFSLRQTYGTSDGIFVQADSTDWTGTIEGLPAVTGANFQPIKSGDVSGLSNVRTTLYRDALPTQGTYLVDVEVAIRHAASGQPKRYRCTATGTYGATPPTWAAVEVQP